VLALLARQVVLAMIAVAAKKVANALGHLVTAIPIVAKFVLGKIVNPALVIIVSLVWEIIANCLVLVTYVEI
jgi:hypothetical protein